MSQPEPIHTLDDSLIANRIFRFSLADGVKVSQAIVNIFAITETQTTPLASINLDSHSFINDNHQDFVVELDTSNDTFFYVCAQLLEVESSGHKISLSQRMVELIAVFKNTDEVIVINEPSTIASAFCFNRFISISPQANTPSMRIQSSEARSTIGYGMKNNFYTTAGEISDIISNSPNAMETNSYALFNFLSNLVFYNVVEPDCYHRFLEIEPTANNTFFSSLLFLIQNPFHQVDAIYQLVSSQQPYYTPTLSDIVAPEGQSQVPNQFTLTIKVTHTGANNFLFGGPAYVVFDKNDRAWIVNNVRQGTPNSSSFCVVLESDGSPAQFSPLFGGGLLGGGFGIATDQSGDKIFIGNYGWGPTQCNPQVGSVSGFDCEGNAITPTNGYTNDLCRVQGLNFDRHGNLWMSSWGTQTPLAPSGGNYYPFESQNSAIVVYPDADPKRSIKHAFASPDHCTFDVIIDDNDIAYVSNAGSAKGEDGYPVPSSLHKFRLNNDTLEHLAAYTSDSFEGFRQVVLDKEGNIYVGAIESNLIYKFSVNDTNLENPEKISTETVNRAWGITIDDDNNIFVANFGKDIGKNIGKNIDKDQHYDNGLGVTVFPAGHVEQAKVMTLPSGGDEVCLPNGFPLYGMHAFDNPNNRIVETQVWPQCYQPLMRLTSTNNDRAGNLWAINNWKPSGLNDLTENPGGDGAVIFIGVAQPRK